MSLRAKLRRFEQQRARAAQHLERRARRLAASPIPAAGWRSLGEGARYEPWVSRLRRRSGVYLVREAKGEGAILYVGESHTGKLYETLTRHFQSWQGETAGPTYSRRSVVVKVIYTPRDRASERQFALIQKFRPRDNVYRGDGGSDVPF